MGELTEPYWLGIARELRALAQTGLTFTQDRFDRQRYLRLREISAEMLARGSGADPAEVLDILGLDQGYATPKVDVRGAAFVEGRVLLVREISNGLWSLPGGWADIHQSPAEGVVREIAEESGFTARALKLAAVRDYHRSGHPPRSADYIYKLFFICEITGGAARPSEETSEVAFFARDALPPLSLGRVTPAEIEEMFCHKEQPDLPTYFE